MSGFKSQIFRVNLRNQADLINIIKNKIKNGIKDHIFGKYLANLFSQSQKKKEKKKGKEKSRPFFIIKSNPPTDYQVIQIPGQETYRTH